MREAKVNRQSPFPNFYRGLKRCGLKCWIEIKNPGGRLPHLDLQSSMAYRAK
jgi:hypothetical protein